MRSLPSLLDGSDQWAQFAPFATLTGVGSPWYMSPARLCGFFVNHQCSDNAEIQLTWDIVSAGRGLRFEDNDEGMPHAIVSVRGVCDDPKRTVQASEPAPHFSDGAYYELDIRRLWPLEIL